MKYFSRIYIVILILFATTLSAQNKSIIISVNNVPVKEALAEIQRKSGYRILYNDEVIPENMKVSVVGKNLPVEKAFEQMFANTDLTYVMHSDKLVVITDKKFVNNNSDFFGIVTDDKKVPVSFANVLLFNGKEERPVYSAVTDLNGNFQILQVARGKYRLVISFVGYDGIDQPFTISDNVKETYLLKTKPTTLATVNVDGKSVNMNANKQVFIILPKDLQGAKSALDLFSKIPSVYVDQVNEKIKSNRGGAVKLLLNGTNATEIDFKSLRPNDIQRLEYYDIPPARYSEYKTVINVITKVREDGIAAGVDMNHVFTTGFWNDNAYFKYNKGKNQFSVDFAQYHRNYSNRQFTKRYAYTFQGKYYERNALGKDKFGYDDDEINLTYSNQDIDKYAFQIKFSPNYMNYHADGTTKINYAVVDSLSDRNATNWTRRNEFTPVIDVYYWQKLKNQQEIAFNVVGTAFNTSNKYLNDEKDIDGNTALYDDMNQQNRKYSIIGEVNYSRPLSFGTMNIGYNLDANTMNTKVLNSFDNTNYNTSYFQNYAYAEWTAQKNRWMYMGSLGLAYRNQNSYEQKRSDWIFKPRAMVGYNFSSANSLKLVFERSTQEPSLASLSNNRVYVTDHIVRQGNPSLRISTVNELDGMYNLNTPFLNVSVIPAIQYIANPINSYFTQGDDYIIQMSENGKHTLTYGVSYSAVIKPFRSELLTIKAQGQYFKTEQTTSQIGYFSHIYSPLWYDMTWKYHNWALTFSKNIIGKNLSGTYLSTDENQEDFMLKYVKSNWSLQAGLWWIGQPSMYKTNTIPKSIVEYRAETRIFDNKNMFSIGFSYNFNKGKKYNQKAKTLNNSDTDSGAF